MAQMKSDLRLSVEPRHIECFDNSNIQGTNPVAACVVFKDGKPSKKDYRKFNIKTVTGANDFASMEEVVFRRYRRLLNEDEPLPQLISFTQVSHHRAHFTGELIQDVSKDQEIFIYLLFL